MLKKFISFATALTLLVCVSMTASAAGGKTAVVNTMDILVDDAAAMPSGYVIEGYTYFKLRDIAYLMQDKSCKFSVSFSSSARRIDLKTGAAYTPDGSEMQAFTGGKQTATLSDMIVRVNGSEVALEAYNIKGYTYYKLRDLGDALGFTVNFDTASRLIMITTMGTVPSPEPEPEFDVDAHLDGKITILLDPGHGGTDPGASSPDRQYDENHLNLEVAGYLKDMLEAQGVTVLMTRTDTDTYPTLSDRSAMIKQYRESLDFFLCIHHNSGGGTGAEVLVPSDKQDPSGESKEMAALVLKEFSALGLKNRGQKDGSGMAVIKGASASDVPGILTEFCFLDTADLEYVKTAEGRRAEAEALCNAVMAFFATHAY